MDVQKTELLELLEVAIYGNNSKFAESILETLLRTNQVLIE
jgi:hypothetical protein